MMMPGRKYTASNLYRYGFNGKENDNDIKGEGNEQDYGMRCYDTRLGRLLSVDPLDKQYPWYTPYQFAGNKPIKYIDKLGAQEEKHWYDYNFNDLTQWFEKPSNPFKDDGFVHKLGSSINRNFNPLYYSYVIITGHDPSSSDYQKMGRGDAAQNLALLIILHKTLTFATKPTSALAMEQQLTKNAAGMGSTNAGKKIIADETTSNSSGKFSKNEVDDVFKYMDNLHGSGPASGVLEVSSNVKSVQAFKNYKPSQPIEFVYDPINKKFLVGQPNSKIAGLSGHQQLVKVGKLNGDNTVGGMFTRGTNGEILTNEYSGHYYQNWTDEIRKQFREFLQSKTSQKIIHTQ